MNEHNQQVDPSTSQPGMAAPIGQPAMDTNQPSSTVEVASIGNRIAGGIIDFILFSLLMIAIAYAGGMLEMSQTASGQGTAEINDMPFLILGLLTYILMAVCESKWSATPGKLVMGTRVVNEHSHESISFGAALGRNLMRIIDWLPFIYIIGLICIGVTKNNQRLGDLVAHTLVIKK